MRMVMERRLLCCWRRREPLSKAQILMMRQVSTRSRQSKLRGGPRSAVWLMPVINCALTLGYRRVPKYSVGLIFGCIMLAVRTRGPVSVTGHMAGANQLNLNAAFYAMQAVLPHMVAAQAGSIINISSIAGQRYIGKPQVGYAAAKAGLMQLTKTTAVIHAKDNVRINCVVPGLMHTPMLRSMAEKYAGGDLDGFIAKRNSMVPMRRMGNAHDVANAVLFLAADESSYITATDIVVDGGITAANRVTAVI